MFREAFVYPSQADDAAKTVMLGGLLTALAPVLLLPFLPLIGYLLRVIDSTATGDRGSPPPLDEWRDMFVEGGKGTLVVLCYAIPCTILANVSYAFYLAHVFTTAESGSGGFFWVVLALLPVVAIVCLTYLLSASLAVYARKRRLKLVLAPSELCPLVTRREYAGGWFAVLGVGLVTAVIAVALFASFVGIVLIPIVLFYGLLSGSYAIGAGVAAISDTAPIHEPWT